MRGENNMELRIEIRGVEEHASLIEEELRGLRKFEDHFESYQMVSGMEPGKSRGERERIRRLRESVEARRHFLETLPEEYRKLEKQLQDIKTM